MKTLNRMPETSSTTASSSSPFWRGLTTALIWVGKAWLVVTAVIGTLLVLGIVAIVMVMSNSSSDTALPTPLSQKIVSVGSEGTIALVNISGEISEEAPSTPLGGGVTGVSARRMTRLLDKLAEDDQVDAVVLRIDSPGGGVVASDEIYRKVKALREVKPVVVSMGNVAASGGYYIAAGANYIVANPSTLTGSIGVIAQFPELSGLFDMIGVELRTFKSGEFKDMGSPTRQITTEESQILTSVTTQAYDQFVQAIVDGREMDEAVVRQLGDGRIYTGQQAEENGLVDQVGTLDDAIAIAGTMAQVSDPTVSEFSDQSFWQALLESNVGSIGLGARIDHLLPVNRNGLYYLMEL